MRERAERQGRLEEFLHNATIANNMVATDPSNASETADRILFIQEEFLNLLICKLPYLSFLE